MLLGILERDDPSGVVLPGSPEAIDPVVAVLQH
jgi:hypothetical protein